LVAARESAPGLQAGQLYVDLNSVSPGRKQEIDAIVRATGADFVEVTMMAPVPPYLQKVPILAGGARAAEVERTMAPFGMKMEVLGDKIGVASATKMCRSVMVKGIEALLTECVLAATYYGAAEAVLTSLGDTFPGPDWNEQASYCVGRVVEHGGRRAREMEEAAATLREAGVEPIMAEATVRRMDWSVELGLKELFHGEAPADYTTFAEEVRKRTPQGVRSA
jgi:3-hydroxyisobutyrate dehydrogenase-like beta-hydroxyacid dehydrogenase